MLRAKTNTSSRADNPASKRSSETTLNCWESRAGMGSAAGYGHGMALWAGRQQAGTVATRLPGLTPKLSQRGWVKGGGGGVSTSS